MSRKREKVRITVNNPSRNVRIRPVFMGVLALSLSSGVFLRNRKDRSGHAEREIGMRREVHR